MRQSQELDALGRKILSELRTELYLAMRFMGPALDALGYQLDLRTRTVGTDAEVIRFNPLYLVDTFIAHPRRLLRCYMHMLMHCLFRHLFARKRYEDGELFDLCADIAAESLLDSMHVTAVFEIPSDFRESWYEKLRSGVQILTAEKLYAYFTEYPLSVDDRFRLTAEFVMDDHSFWQDLKDDPPEQQPENSPARREEQWKDRAKNTEQLLAASGSEASDERGSLSWMLAYEKDSKTDYRDFLRRFMSLREEMRIDPDGFDYGYYTYGLELYGDMPLIEENEYRETVAVDQLVIAIDTSASTRPHLVRRFLRETAAILSSQETFFHHVQIHLIECDDQVQSDRLLTDVKELDRYADHFEVRGGMGTDFRPVFSHVRELIRRGNLPDLRGLMYFTDGYGIYPEEPTSYDTAFVFCTDADYDDRGVPSWAMRLYTVPEETRYQRPSRDKGVSLL